MVAGRERVTHRVEAQGGLIRAQKLGDRFSPVQHASLAVPRCAAPCHSCHVMVCNGVCFFSNDGCSPPWRILPPRRSVHLPLHALAATCNTPANYSSYGL